MCLGKISHIYLLFNLSSRRLPFSRTTSDNHLHPTCSTMYQYLCMHSHAKIQLCLCSIEQIYQRQRSYLSQIPNDMPIFMLKTLAHLVQDFFIFYLCDLNSMNIGRRAQVLLTNNSQYIINQYVGLVNIFTIKIISKLVKIVI